MDKSTEELIKSNQELIKRLEKNYKNKPKPKGTTNEQPQNLTEENPDINEPDN